MIDHNHFICHFIFGGHLLNIPTKTRLLFRSNCPQTNNTLLLPYNIISSKSSGTYTFPLNCEAASAV